MNIVTRAQWGARYGNGFGLAPIPAREVWLHHSVTASPSPDREHAAMRQLEAIGQSRFGGGVSYTWAVMPSGTVYEGHSPNRRGAHTKGRNSTARAIVLVGNYDVDQVSDAQVKAVIRLLDHARRSGWIATARLNGGHRQVPGAQTACPGRFGMGVIPVINGSGGAQPPESHAQPSEAGTGAATLPTLRHGSTGPAVAALQGFMRRTFPSYAGHLPVTGNYLDQTRTVIREFQGRVGIDKDGITGPDTNRHLWDHGYRGA